MTLLFKRNVWGCTGFGAEKHDFALRRGNCLLSSGEHADFVYLTICDVNKLRFPALGCRLFIFESPKLSYYFGGHKLPMLKGSLLAVMISPGLVCWFGNLTAESCSELMCCVDLGLCVVKFSVFRATLSTNFGVRG